MRQLCKAAATFTGRLVTSCNINLAGRDHNCDDVMYCFDLDTYSSDDLERFYRQDCECDIKSRNVAFDSIVIQHLAVRDQSLPRSRV
jgi:hypothetical protein